MLDQGANSLVTFAGTVALARTGTVQQFAAFAIASSVFFVCVSAFRSLTTTPLLINFGGMRSQVLMRRRSVRWINGVVVCAGSALGLLSNWLAGGEAGNYFLIVSLVPLLLLDAERYILIAAGRVALSAFGSCAFLLVFLLGMLSVSVIGTLGFFGALSLWACSAQIVTMAYWFGSRLKLGGNGVPERSVAMRSYLASAWRSMSALTVESVMLAGASQAVVFVLAIWGSDGEVTGYRVAVSVVLGIWTTLLMGVLPQLQILFRSWVRYGYRPPVAVYMIAAGVVSGTVLTAFIALAMPTSLWHSILGQSTTSARGMLWQAVVVVAATSGAGVIWMALRYTLGIGLAVKARTVSTLSLVALFTLLLSLGLGIASFAIYSAGLMLAAIGFAVLIHVPASPSDAGNPEGRSISK